MNRLVKISALLLLASITVQADPFKLWNWTPPALYENGNPIPVTDTLTYTLHCNDVPMQQGPPYEVQIALDGPGAPPSQEDMAPVVQGRAGTYYCVATSRSSSHGTESEFSNEANFTVTAASLGYVPQAIQDLSLQ